MARSLAAVLLMLGALAGCSTPYKEPQFASNGDPTPFDGIAGAMAIGRPLDVILVHGMCTHDASWATEAVQALYASLGEDPKEVKLVERTVAGSGILLYQQELPTRRGPLRMNAIRWSPLTTPLKGRLCYDQTNKSATCPADEAKKTYPYRRARLNRMLKDTILDDCLSDAMIYQGKARDEISQQMQKAVLQAIATSGGSPTPMAAALHARAAEAVPQDRPLIVVSESLGSKVAFDALDQLSKRPTTAAAADRTWNRITQIFMGANQLPILALADRTLDGTVARAAGGNGYAEDPIASLVQRRAAQPSLAGVNPPRIVAFTDPNDLLSYILVPSANATGYSVTDVVVSNDSTLLGLVERPDTAHLGYRTNETVRRLMACGTSGKGCR